MKVERFKAIVDDVPKNRSYDAFTSQLKLIHDIFREKDELNDEFPHLAKCTREFNNNQQLSFITNTKELILGKKDEIDNKTILEVFENEDKFYEYVLREAEHFDEYEDKYDLIQAAAEFKNVLNTLKRNFCEEVNL